MKDGKYVLGKGEKVLWEGSTIKGANLKEKGTDFKAIFISFIVIAVSVGFVAVTGYFMFISVAFIGLFAVMGNLCYQTGKFVVTNKRVLFGKRRNGMMYYTSITRNCHLTCYKSDRNIGFVKCIKDVKYSKQNHKTVYIRGVENPEQVCSVLQSVVDCMS